MNEDERIAKLEQKIADLSVELERKGRLDMKTVVLILAPLAAMWGLLIAPVQAQFRERSQLDIARHEALEGRVAELWFKQYGQEMSRTGQYHVIGDSGGK